MKIILATLIALSVISITSVANAGSRSQLRACYENYSGTPQDYDDCLRRSGGGHHVHTRRHYRPPYQPYYRHRDHRRNHGNVNGEIIAGAIVGLIIGHARRYQPVYVQPAPPQVVYAEPQPKVAIPIPAKAPRALPKGMCKLVKMFTNGSTGESMRYEEIRRCNASPEASIPEEEGSGDKEYYWQAAD